MTLMCKSLTGRTDNGFLEKSADPWDIDPDERRLASEPAEKLPVCWIPSGGIGTLCGRNGRRHGRV